MIFDFKKIYEKLLFSLFKTLLWTIPPCYIWYYWGERCEKLKWSRFSIFVFRIYAYMRQDLMLKLLWRKNFDYFLYINTIVQVIWAIWACSPHPSQHSGGKMLTARHALGGEGGKFGNGPGIWIRTAWLASMMAYHILIFIQSFVKFQLLNLMIQMKRS